MTKQIVVLIDGPDAEQALAELIANVKYDNLEVAIWIADNPKIVAIPSSSLSYSPDYSEDEIKEMLDKIPTKH